MVAAWWMMWKLTAEFILDGNYSSVRRTGGGGPKHSIGLSEKLLFSFGYLQRTKFLLNPLAT